MAAPKLKMRLGDLLVHERIISNEQLMQALSSQKQTGRKLGDTLIELSYLSERQLLQFLAQQLDVPFLDISQHKISANVASLLPEVHARRLRALIIEDRGASVLLGMSDPADLSGLDQLERMLSPKRIELAVVLESQIFDAFDSLYRRTAEIESFASQLEEEYEESSSFDLATTFLDEGGDATVGKLLQSVFEDAVQMRASDIHIEPEEHQLRIRQRIDGVLQEKILKENKIASAMVLRLKLMAGLDISEKRLPQDGRFNLEISGHNIDVRMSTMPVQYGESVVMRLLDQSAGLLSLDQTGMPAEMVKRVRQQIHRPHGMVLVTGPTGSGKTTTLYAALSELNDASKKIITVEDPVEYRLPRINQVQVNTKIDLTFSRILRSALRQDPDIMMVGEMRDQETVEIGLRGAITGHLVLSTLHTNDAITSALRLIDMGAAGFLVGSALRAVVAQRLVRRVCDSCATEYQADAQEILWLTNLAGEQAKTSQFMHGKGCQSCHYTGYKGRIGVFELLEMNEGMMAALKRNDSEAFGKLAKESPGFTPLAQAAFAYAVDGITTVEEVLRLVETIDIN
ncbi:MSHA biogenesis protein MshE [Colwellia sp. MT41]|uniref:MSHA biogenesis protein MshE n=1 Tax=Colwellia marinimaniae TaxID=1513592 RepID=A0ABQ0MPV7_9GAMM|nr:MULTISPECIES: GspE/PulE family protein [Colwellia]ALO36069.1 MSHA biogenesis protein MshE [Colwellia sp. MT41]GAW94413.1 MSHA biogenesis protein MshE [Colwellia marinimaniae]